MNSNVGSAAAAILVAAPGIAKALKGPLAALEIHLRYPRRRLRVKMKDGSVVEGTLLGQGIPRMMHTLRIQDDWGNEHLVTLAEINQLIVVRSQTWEIRNPGRSVLGFGLFPEIPSENLPADVREVLLRHSRVEKEELMPGLVAFRLLDAPWAGMRIEVGEAAELEENPALGEPLPPVSFDAIRGTTELGESDIRHIRDVFDQCSTLEKDLGARLRAGGTKVGEYFFLQVESKEARGITQMSAGFLAKIAPGLDVKTIDTYVEGDDLMIFQEEGKTTILITGPPDRLRTIFG